MCYDLHHLVYKADNKRGMLKQNTSSTIHKFCRIVMHWMSTKLSRNAVHIYFSLLLIKLYVRVYVLQKFNKIKNQRNKCLHVLSLISFCRFTTQPANCGPCTYLLVQLSSEQTIPPRQRERQTIIKAADRCQRYISVWSTSTTTSR